MFINKYYLGVEESVGSGGCGAGCLNQFDQCLSQWVTRHVETSLVGCSVAESVVCQNPQMFGQRDLRNSASYLNLLKCQRTIKQFSDNPNAAFVCEIGGDAAHLKVAIRRISLQGGLNGMQNGCGRRDLRIGLHGVNQPDPLASGGKEPSGLNAAKFLARI